MPHLALVCGRYEGIDERVRTLVDREVSIGDYVLTGGELPALVLIDAVVRLVPGVIAEASHEGDSFASGLLEYPQYTRPETFRDLPVPPVLLSGTSRRGRPMATARGVAPDARAAGRTCSRRPTVSDEDRRDRCDELRARGRPEDP